MKELDDFNDECISAHNGLRNCHNVPPLSYDRNLAVEAEKYAKVIADGQSLVHSSPEQRKDCGENLACSMKSFVNYTFSGLAVTVQWYAEIKDYDFNLEKQITKKPIGHFTQVIWKGTQKAGFGKVKNPINNMWYVVGRYSPAGNCKDSYKKNVPPLPANLKWDHLPITDDFLEELRTWEYTRGRKHILDTYTCSLKSQNNVFVIQETFKPLEGEVYNESQVFQSNIMKEPRPIFRSKRLLDSSIKIQVKEPNKTQSKEPNKTLAESVKEPIKLSSGVPTKPQVIDSIKTTGKELTKTPTKEPNKSSTKVPPKAPNKEPVKVTPNEIIKTKTDLSVKEKTPEQIKTPSKDLIKTTPINISNKDSNKDLTKPTTTEPTKTTLNKPIKELAKEPNKVTVKAPIKQFVNLPIKPFIESPIIASMVAPVHSSFEIPIDTNDGVIPQDNNEESRNKLSPEIDFDPGAEEFIKCMVERHNLYRRQYGVETLLLDIDLSRCARQWANILCDGGFLGFSNYKYENSDIGENIAMKNDELCQESSYRLIDNWYDENKFYLYDNNKNDENIKEFGHFTQIIWKNTKKIGIGVSTNSSGFNFIVCFYYPPGNIKNKFNDMVPRLLFDLDM